MLLVPGFSTTEILSLGVLRNVQKHACRSHALPIAEYRNSYFEDLPSLLQQAGFEVRIAMLESNTDGTPSILINANCLRNQVIHAAQESPTKSVTLIAHSMGGLVARAFVQSEQFLQDRLALAIPLVRAVIVVGTPNDGLRFPFFGDVFRRFLSQTRQRAACEFTNPAWMADFNLKYSKRPSDVEMYAVAGTHFGGALGRITGGLTYLIAGPNDGSVPVRSALAVQNFTARVIYPESHQRSVGTPSYFTGMHGQPSRFFTDCVLPVLSGEGICLPGMYLKRGGNRG